MDRAETELYVIRRVVVAQAEIVIVRVDPVGPRRFVRYGPLSYVVPQPRANLEVGSDVFGQIVAGLDIYVFLKVRLHVMPVTRFRLCLVSRNTCLNSPLWQ